ncbi:hypothetical protein RJ641_029378 [Dillenia turbinata]|uniref:Uncharacterized protein n=1 Tax=Dillenia turbinata TaxID=194707 RepID=A0AAN8W1M1_9MAGN
MRGVGGPLLCIGDVLSDVGDGEGDVVKESPLSASTPSSPSSTNLRPSDLSKLFQENYDQLNEALAGTDHSWTALTLKLCTALETANKLIHTTSSNAGLLSEKLVDLEKIIKKGDSAVAAAKSMSSSLNKKNNS